MSFTRSVPKSKNFADLKFVKLKPVMLIEESNPILYDQLYKNLTKKDLNIYALFKDTEGWYYNLKSGDKDFKTNTGTQLWLSVRIETFNSQKCAPKFMEGVDEFIEKSNAIRPNKNVDLENQNFAFGWDVSSNQFLVQQEIEKKAKEIAEQTSKLKTTISQYPIQQTLRCFLSKNIKSVKDYEIEQQKDKYLWVIPKEDTIVIIFRITNSDPIKKLLMTAIAKELKVMSKKVGNCPISNYSIDPPTEINKQIRFNDETDETFICQLNFVFTDIQARSEDLINNSAKLMIRFSDYLSYHITCSHSLLNTIVTDKIEVLCKSIREKMPESGNYDVTFKDSEKTTRKPLLQHENVAFIKKHN